MNERYQYVSMAALLHDIGKLGQRAHESSSGLSPDTTRLKELLCPFNRTGGYRTHTHVLYTYEFITLIKSHLPQSINSTHLANLASRHHQPESEDDRLLARADHLASGLERPVVDDTYGEQSFLDSFRRIRLSPIAARIGMEEQPPISETHDAAEWENDSSIFFPKKHDVADISPYMLNLWESLLTRVKANNCRDFWPFFTRLFSDLEATIWSIPAATNVRQPDVSLFDHSRAVSVIAGCLALAEDNDTPYLLVAGDFSGIQGFVYDLKYVEETEDAESRKGYARRLRGRSLGVRLFAEQAALFFLKRQELTVAHRILSAGGKLYLLLPNRRDIQQALTAMQHQIQEWSLNRSHGRIRFNLTSMNLTNGDLANFPETISRLNSAISESAQKALAHSLTRTVWQSSRFLLPPIEQDRHAASGDPFKNIDRNWGAELPSSSCLAMMVEPDSNHPLPFTAVRLVRDEADIPEASDLVLLLEGKQPSGKFAYQRARIARYVPTDSDGGLLTFEDIAERAKGRHALGFIKADVDDLGKTFRFGFGKSSSFSHVATLSRMLEGFFGVYVEELVRKEFSDIYLVYSGGDDLAAVGPWDQAIDFMLKLRGEFGRFTCRNPSWGFSAGIYIGNPHTPLLSAIEAADMNLEESKRHEGKDSVTFFDTTLTWDLAACACELGKRLAGWLDDKTLSVSQVRRLQHYGLLRENYVRTQDTSHLRYAYLLAYDVKRNWGEKSDGQKAAKEWVQKFSDPQHKEFRYLNVATQYALYTARGRAEENQTNQEET